MARQVMWTMLFIVTGVSATTDELTWSPLPNDNRLARDAATSVQFDGKMFVVGGVNPKTMRSGMIKGGEFLNLTTLEWSTLPNDMSVGRMSPTSVQFDGKMFVVGGSERLFNEHKSGEVLNLTTLEWSPLPSDMSVKRDEATSVQFDGKMFVVGGMDRDNYHKSGEFLNLTTLEWSPLPKNMSVGRSSATSVEFNGKMFVVGGFYIEGSLSTRQIYLHLKSGEVLDLTTLEWSTLPNDMSVGRASSTSVQFDGKMFVVGGYSNGYLDSGEILDLTTLEWSPLPNDMGLTRAGSTSVQFNGKMFVVGANYYSGDSTGNDDDIMFSEVLELRGSAVTSVSKTTATTKSSTTTSLATASCRTITAATSNDDNDNSGKLIQSGIVWIIYVVVTAVGI